MVNIPFLAAALLLTAAFFAHLIVGTRETLSLRTDGEKDRRNWMQALCVFQLVSVDLFLTAAAAYLLACTQMAGVRREIAYFIAAYLGAWAWYGWCSSKRQDAAAKTIICWDNGLCFFSARD